MEESTTKMVSKKIDEIDALRGIGVIWVAYFHMSGSFKISYSLLVDNFIKNGYLGVTLFFIVSGFLIHTSFTNKYSNIAKPKLSFYVGRALRILPLWWVAVIVYWLYGYVPTEKIPHYMTFVFGFFTYLPEYNQITIAWTLFIEETFYLIYPLLAVLLFKLRHALEFWMFCLLLYGIALVYLPDSGLPYNSTYFYNSPLAHFHYLALGVVGACLYKSGHLTRFFHLLNEKKAGSLLDLFFVVFTLYYANSSNDITRYLMILAIVFAVFTKGSLIRKIAMNRLFRSFGKNCYFLYLFHPILLYELTQVWFAWPFQVLAFKKFVFFFLFTGAMIALNGLAILSKKYFEDAIIRFGQAKFIKSIQKTSTLPH